MKKIYFLVLMLFASAITHAQKTEKIQISSEYDDMEEYLPATSDETQDSTIGELDYDSKYIELGYRDGDKKTPQLSGFRFDGIEIGKGRTIDSAYIEFNLYLDTYIDACNFYIFAEDTTDAAEFATEASSMGGGPGGGAPGGAPGGSSSSSEPEYDSLELSVRTKLTDSINWTIAANQYAQTDTVFRTPDIKFLVQQLINKAEWDSTNAMAFYIKGNLGTRIIDAYENDEAAAATLYITFELTHSDSVAIYEDSVQSAKLDSIVKVKVGDLNEDDYTIPTWTLLKRAEVTFKEDYDYKNDTASETLQEAVDSLQSKDMPYNVCMAINGDAETQLGFTWFTNKGIEAGEVQIIEGEVTDISAFDSPDVTFSADSFSITQPYCNSSNGLDELAGFENGDTRSYTVHKALATGGTANTVYSYRVGKAGAWSPIGSFKTGDADADTLRFMYMADTQAMNDTYFSVSQDATLAAAKTIPDAQFLMMTGDFVESSGSSSSEWEWEQWFELMQPVWKGLPIAPVVGNHDKSSNKNLSYHFNTDSVSFDQSMSTTPGGVYSFVQGDALFIAMSTEDYSVDGYLDSLKQYVYDEVAAHPDVRWKFVFYHKTIYTGSSSHQSDADSKTVREEFVPVFDSLGIDMAFQGHDHIYEVIGATRNYALVDSSVIAIDSTSEEGGVRANMTGKTGGIFDVTDGTLFFLNCSAGKKKYSPRTQDEMDEAESATGITNYWGLFTGKFGQPDLATFSDVVVTYDTVYVTTYTVDDDGNTIDVYDSFKVTKDSDRADSDSTNTDTDTDDGSDDSGTTDDTDNTDDSDNTDNTSGVANQYGNEISIYPNPVKSVLTVSGIESADKIGIFTLSGQRSKLVSNTNTVDVSDLDNGIYFIKVKTDKGLYIDQFVIKK